MAAELSDMRKQLDELRALLAEKDKEIHAMRAERNMGETRRKTNGGDRVITPPSTTATSDAPRAGLVTLEQQQQQQAHQVNIGAAPAAVITAGATTTLTRPARATQRGRTGQ